MEDDMTDVIQILKDANEKALEVHTKMMSDYFPGKGHGGIHEVNLVSIYIESIKQICGYENVSAWLEVQCLKGKKGKKGKKNARPARLDAAIQITTRESIVILEAKRIRQYKTNGKYNSEIALKSISRDSKRLIKIDESESIISKSSAKKVYRVLLSSIWMSDAKNMQEARNKWMSKEAFSDDWELCVVSETKDDPSSDKHFKLLLAINGPDIIKT